MKTRTSHFVAAFALFVAFAGVLLLAGEAVVRDQAMIFAAIAALAASAALAVVALPTAFADSTSPWADVAWGKFFVAVVYASIAVTCIVATAHTADAARFAHAVAAVF